MAVLQSAEVEALITYHKDTIIPLLIDWHRFDEAAAEAADCPEVVEAHQRRISELEQLAGN